MDSVIGLGGLHVSAHSSTTPDFGSSSPHGAVAIRLQRANEGRVATLGNATQNLMWSLLAWDQYTRRPVHHWQMGQVDSECTTRRMVLHPCGGASTAGSSSTQSSRSARLATSLGPGGFAETVACSRPVTSELESWPRAETGVAHEEKAVEQAKA